MGIVSRYVERLTAMARSKRAAPLAVSADAEGLRLGAERLAWSNVRRLDAYKRDTYVGDVLCLAILGDSGRIFEINEESPGWKEAGGAIERFLPGSLPYAEWIVRLVAADAGESVVVYPAAPVDPAGRPR